MRARSGQAGEVRQSVERKIDLRGGPSESIVMNVLDELVRELARFDEAQKRQARIDARCDDTRADFVTVVEDDALRLVATYENAFDLRLRSDLDTGGASGAGDRV